jgi:response regulator RpfG family c-di-GMP phosphodiesterase
MNAMEDHDDDLVFCDDDDTPTLTERTWKVMLVDDEQAIHDVTRLALSDFSFAGRSLEFISVYSARDALEAIRKHPDTAVMLLDVVMETEHAGLEVARAIREDIGNRFVRIVLRTGQPGQAPERRVIADYDINDYKEKTELTSQKLATLMYASLRSYRDIIALEKSKRGLEAVIEASAQIFGLASTEDFPQSVLMQTSSLLKAGCDSPDCKTDGLAAQRLDDGSFKIVAAIGEYRKFVDETLSRESEPEAVASLEDAFQKGQSIISDTGYTSAIKSRNGVQNLLHMRCCESADLNELDKSLMDIFQRNVAIASENLELLHEVEQTQREIVYILGETVETRSKETGHHVKRVAEISKMLALEYGLDTEEAETIEFASPLHDIGKIGIPDAILNKPGKLTEDEWEIMKTHAMLGYEMLKSSNKKILRAGAIIARDHHEKWAGGGYPANKSGEDIHLYGRITAVADVFDALGSERSYKKAWPLDDIIAHMRSERGKHFEPRLVDILLDNIDTVAAICQANKD